MRPTLLLYGASGFSGRLLAEELAREDERGQRACDLIIAGRDAGELARMSEELDVPYRVFGLDERREVRTALRDADVVLNAAGPFAATAERLAKVALEVGSDYVDIGGESDIFRRLIDLVPDARARHCVIAPCVGFWAAASNLLLDLALDQAATTLDEFTVRIAMSRIEVYSPGSVATVWRSLREQVLVVRAVRDKKGVAEMRLWHEPVGRLERRFDLRDPEDAEPRICIGSAVSLVDTIAALHTLRKRGLVASAIESYVEMDEAERMLYQAGSWLTPVTALPWLRKAMEPSLQMLSLPPSAAERKRSPHLVLLELEAADGSVQRWRWKTPNVYEFTARIAAAIAVRIGSNPDLDGWMTASDVLKYQQVDFGVAAPVEEGPLRGTELGFA